MEIYKIKLSNEAKKDYKDIIRYIKYNLCEPDIAKKYADLIMTEIHSLTNMPNKFAPIDSDIIKFDNIRKLIIKNYIAFYRINDATKTISIERILYDGTNWQTKL